MTRILPWALPVALLLVVEVACRERDGVAASVQPPDRPPVVGKRLLLAFSSYRERPKHPQVYFYEHDGLAAGKITGSIPTVTYRSDHHPALSRDGRYCAFASELENQTSKIFVWDTQEKRLLDLPSLNNSPNAQLHPTISGNGQLLAFAAWNRPGASQRWDILFYDLSKKALVTPSGLNHPKFDERMPCLSGDGRYLAFTSNAAGGAGLSDLVLFDRQEGKTVPLPGLNSPHMELTPSLSEDGRLIAFVSDRPGGVGGRDLYLYDRAAGKLLDLPGLNSAAHEQTPALSPDGRYLAFVSERLTGEGERDIFLYDRETRKLLPTPGLNSRREDMDPVIIVETTTKDQE